MREIPEDIIDDVNRIAEELVVYKNKKNLSWSGVYDEVLEKLGLGDKKKDNRLLLNVVSKITRKGYDIDDMPFKLTRFR